MPLDEKTKRLFEKIAIERKQEAQERRARRQGHAQASQASRSFELLDAAQLYRARGRSHYSSSFPNGQGRRLQVRTLDGLALPPAILSLDIETEVTRLRKVEESTISVVGIVPYMLCGEGHYRRGAYRYFLRDEMQALHELLARFEGLILGQNLFDFDYRVLRPHLPLDSIIHKTFDLYFFLSEIDITRGARLSLDVLAKRNLKRRKLVTNRDIPALWRGGDVKTVLRRNERDCDLVVDLWITLVNERRLMTDDRRSDASKVLIEVKDQHLPILFGQQPYMDYGEWVRRLKKWGNARRNPVTGGKTVVREKIAPDDVVIFHRMWCSDCKRNFILRAGCNRIYKPRSTKACPFCKRRLALAEGGP